MIAREPVETTRIFGLRAQILRARDATGARGLLKVFFNDNPLQFARDCRDSARLTRVER
jgi:hypothetical protein